MKPLVTSNDILNTYRSECHGKKAIEKYKFWFPIKSSKILSGIIADLMFDGHLQDKPKLRLDYTSKNIPELKRFGKEVYKLFKVKGKVRKCTTNKFGTYNYGINCKPLARVLILCGVPTEAKIKKSYQIPKWILKDKEFFREFVKRFYMCEASKCPKDYWIGFEQWKLKPLEGSGTNFMNQIRNGMKKHFNISSSRVYRYNKSRFGKDGLERIGLRFTIHGRKQFEKFQNEINLKV